MKGEASGEGTMTPAAAVATVMLNTESEEQKAELAEALAEVTDYSFTSQFNEISFEGESKGVEIAGATEDTGIMLINPETGEMVILKPDKDGKFHFPFKGLFAVMDPAPVNVG